MTPMKQLPSEALDENGEIVAFDTPEEAHAYTKAMWERNREMLERADWLIERGLPLDTSDERIAEVEADEEIESGVIPDIDEDYEDL